MEHNSAIRWWRRIQWQCFLLGALIVACSFYLMAIGNGHDLPCPDSLRDFLQEGTSISRRIPAMEARGVVAANYGLFFGGGLILISLILFVPTWFQSLFTWSHIGGRDIWRKRD